MENASKALLIAGAILIVVLIIGAGMFITNTSKGSVDQAMLSMSTQEIDAFNLKFTMYDGEQPGANIKALIGTLISNSNVNKAEVTKIPGVYFELSDKSTLDSGIPEPGNNSEYVKGLEKIKGLIEAKHKYWVEISYQDNGLLDYINISYDKTKTVEPILRNK